MTTSADPATLSDPALLAAAGRSKAWPFEEARKVLSRLKRIPKPTGAIIFETGYGPSGLPHIGTFGEVARTTMVRHAFRVLTEDKVPTRLIAFSDDMDGLRKVPGNIPNKDMVAEHLGKPLTQVPDPFGLHPSFGQHNNARLKAFLDTFGFDYEFLSATECYTSGRFDAALLNVLHHYEAVRDVILPTLGLERRAVAIRSVVVPRLRGRQVGRAGQQPAAQRVEPGPVCGGRAAAQDGAEAHVEVGRVPDQQDA